MRVSFDPIHDLGHVTRVVENTQKIGRDMHCTPQELQILELAGWWHDVGRAIVKKPSLWLIFVDDIISTCSLLIHIVKFNIFNKETRTAATLILCHSFGSGKLFSTVLLGKRNTMLLDILKDADNLDLLTIERFELMRNFSLVCAKNKYVFRCMIWLSLNTTYIYTRTKAARKYLKEIIHLLIEWVKEQEMYLWHVAQFGEVWMKKTIASLEKLFADITTLELSTHTQ